VSAFISGLELSRRFYQEAVRPTLDAEFPGLPHSAAVLGRGSEVLVTHRVSVELGQPCLYGL
jgi:hypothetical protein